MNAADVGTWRFCPACARPSAEDEFGEQRCACCRRPWEACPCSPALAAGWREAPCTAECGPERDPHRFGNSNYMISVPRLP